LHNSISELSKLYLNNLYNKVFKKESKGYIDDDMKEIMNKFKYDSKKVKDYKRNALSFDKNNNDEEKEEKEENIESLQKCKSIVMEQINNRKRNKNIRNKNYKFLSLSHINSRNDNNKINFRYEKNFNFNNMRYNFYNNSSIFNNDKSQNVSFNLSYNLPSFKKRSRSIINSRKYTIKEMKKKMSIPNSSRSNANNNNNYGRNNDHSHAKNIDNFVKTFGINNDILEKKKIYNKVKKKI
jgi:hypothetical protein